MARPIPAPPAVTSTRMPLAERCIAFHNSARLLGGSLMFRSAPSSGTVSIEQEELRGIARTVAEIHWLLLILLLLYVIFGGAREDAEQNAALCMGIFFYAAPVMIFRYANFSADIRYGLARAKLLSEADDLTGLLNVRGFALAANRLFAQAARHGRATSVLMIDSDNLKGVNDSHGHASGNRLLRQLAECI